MRRSGRIMLNLSFVDRDPQRTPQRPAFLHSDCARIITTSSTWRPAMKRRAFLGVIGSGAIAAWPFAAHAQQTARPVIGFLNSPSAVQWAPFVNAFKRGLKASGYSEGQTVDIEYRWAEG